MSVAVNSGFAIDMVADSAIIITLTANADRDVMDLVRASNHSLSEVFHRALGLYKLAIEAERDGKVVGIATSADMLETRFTGL